MAPEIIVDNSDEFQKLVDNKDIRISKAIVEGILKNITTTKKHIHLLSVACVEEDEVYDITVDRKYFIETLEENLPNYVEEELYEDCQKIVDTINLLKNPQLNTKKRGRPKKNAN